MAAVPGLPVSGHLGLPGRVEDHPVLDAGDRRPAAGRPVIDVSPHRDARVE
jgi:hypothetical protein